MSAPTVDVDLAALDALYDKLESAAVNEREQATFGGTRPFREATEALCAARDEITAAFTALCARVAALEAERDGLRGALQMIADGGLPDVGAALYSDNADEAYADGFGRGCAHVAQMAARALTPEAARDAGRARGEG